MTKNATEFITPLTFESLTKHNVMVSTFEKVADRSVKHISIAQRADIFVIVPATANVIAKIAHGIAEDVYKRQCDMNIVTCFKQPLKAINFRTFIGKGKCLEIQTYLTSTKVDTIIFNQELSPLQIRNLEEIFQIPVLDRTDLILAIFEKRAVTPVARLQIESAQLKKLLPRLIGANTQLGRQSASGKNKGAGEKQLELDRSCLLYTSRCV